MPQHAFPNPYIFEKGASHTAREIANQPELWLQTADKFFQEALSIKSFFEKALTGSQQIILTGAGTSAFIGLSLEGVLFSSTQKITRAIATTDLVLHPMHYLRKDQTPVIISFARSGNSPESCAALELADQVCDKCFHFIITCDADGNLANYKSRNPVYVFTLPPDSNDKSLAMTGSYTSMLLTGLLLAYREEQSFCKMQVKLLAGVASKILNNDVELIHDLAAKGFQRAVFLGSGHLFGTATEAALKLQELTDGQIICKAESYLGFRHGPRAVINDKTLVVYFCSNDEYVINYETDLLNAMKTGNGAMFHLAIAEQHIASATIDAQITLSAGEGSLSEDFKAVCSIVPAQLLGFFKSLQLGLMPDDPSVNGTISRIVEGVTIYAATLKR